jgi:hypothetical protein
MEKPKTVEQVKNERAVGGKRYTIFRWGYRG